MQLHCTLESELPQLGAMQLHGFLVHRQHLPQADQLGDLCTSCCRAVVSLHTRAPSLGLDLLLSQYWVSAVPLLLRQAVRLGPASVRHEEHPLSSCLHHRAHHLLPSPTERAQPATHWPTRREEHGLDVLFYEVVRDGASRVIPVLGPNKLLAQNKPRLKRLTSTIRQREGCVVRGVPGLAPRVVRLEQAPLAVDQEQGSVAIHKSCRNKRQCRPSLRNRRSRRRRI